MLRTCSKCNWYKYDDEKYDVCFNCNRGGDVECELCEKYRPGLPINKHNPKYQMCWDCLKIVQRGGDK